MQTAAATQKPAIMPSAALRWPPFVNPTDMSGDMIAPKRDMELLRPRANDRTRVGYICRDSLGLRKPPRGLRDSLKLVNVRMQQQQLP